MLIRRAALAIWPHSGMLRPSNVSWAAFSGYVLHRESTRKPLKTCSLPAFVNPSELAKLLKVSPGELGRRARGLYPSWYPDDKLIHRVGVKDTVILSFAEAKRVAAQLGIVASPAPPAAYGTIQRTGCWG